MTILKPQSLVMINHNKHLSTIPPWPRYVQDIHGTGLWLRAVARGLLNGEQGTHHPRGGGHAVKDTVGQGKVAFLVGS